MSIRNGLKQLLRTPVKAALFVLLVILSAALLTLGASLWRISTENIAAYESTFTTVGTVQQKQTATRTFSTWNYALQDYRHYIGPVYGPTVPVSALDFERANYIHPPEKRPIYFSYDPGYYTGMSGESGQYQMTYLIAELTPVEDCIPSEPVKMRIVDILYGSMPETISTLEFVSSGNPNPDMLYAGKTYIMCLLGGGTYSANGSIQGLQSDASGNIIPNDLVIDTSWDEVTEGFYETERGKRWLAMIETYDHLVRSIPVTPTQSSNLLIPFHNGEAYIVQGRDISEQEYLNGERVCLVEKHFAQKNSLTPGSTLPLSLIYADYASLSRRTATVPAYLNAKGETYRAFETGDYTVVGIFETTSLNYYSASGYEMIRNEVVIPSASVRGSDENNIVLSSPMKGYDTSFQIANGDIERFMAAWDAQGIQDLDIRFYDRGYTKLKAGMENMKSMAYILLASGIALTVLNLLFFANLLIAKQKKRTAIERSLGTSKARCAVSLLSGFMAVVILGAALGSVCGFLLTGWASENANGESYYSTQYSSWAVNAETAAAAQESATAETLIPVLCGLAVVLFSLLIASAVVCVNLRSEPMRLLSGRES